MVDLEVIQSVYYMVAATGVLVAAVYYVMNIRTNQRNQELMLKAQQQNVETRQLQLFMSIYQSMITRQFQADNEEIHHVWEWKDMNDYLKKYGATNPEMNGKMASVFFTYDGIGVLVKRGFIDPELVYDLTYVQAVEVWEKFVPLIREFRKWGNAPHVFSDFEYLYNTMITTREKRGHSPTSFTDLDTSFMKDKR